jgi:ribosomal-protein-alanine N-acetyltransferase
MFEPVRTRRLVVRRFTLDDHQDFAAYQADPQVRKHVPGEAMTAEQATHYLAAQAVLDEHTIKTWHGYAVQHIESGTVIGDVGIYLVSAVEGDIGCQFHPGFHHQGYGLEAMTAFLSYVFETLKLNQVTAGCDQANTASSALLERLGLQRISSGSDGSYRYELTRDDWLAQH